MPPGFIDPLYQGALAELSHWMVRNERYRGQGDFARIERVFEVIKEALG
jgi:elongation factor P hydroxylase